MWGVTDYVGALREVVSLILGFFYQEIWDAPISIFPWKGIWKGKVPKSVPLFMWTTALCRILTLDGLMRRGLPLVKRWCMFRCNG